MIQHDNNHGTTTITPRIDFIGRNKVTEEGFLPTLSETKSSSGNGGGGDYNNNKNIGTTTISKDALTTTTGQRPLPRVLPVMEHNQDLSLSSPSPLLINDNNNNNIDNNIDTSDSRSIGTTSSTNSSTLNIRKLQNHLPSIIRFGSSKKIHQLSSSSSSSVKGLFQFNNNLL